MQSHFPQVSGILAMNHFPQQTDEHLCQEYRRPTINIPPILDNVLYQCPETTHFLERMIQRERYATDTR